MSFKLGGSEVGPLIMAPLAGYTDAAFRRLVTENGASMAVTEMVSARALLYGSVKTEGLLLTVPSEKIKCLQLFGFCPEDFAAALRLKALNKFDVIDINCGCPVKKIVANGEGSALLSDIPRAQSIVEACVKASGRPVTVKMRLGPDSGHLVAVEFAKAAEESGASALIVHGRTAEQGYSGEADWQAVAAVKKAVDIPVVGNGDVTDVPSYKARRGLADAVMIGRGALADPGIFARLGNTRAPDKKTLILTHLRYLKEYYGERYAVLSSRKFMAYYFKGEAGFKEARIRLTRLETFDELTCGVTEALDALKGAGE